MHHFQLKRGCSAPEDGKSLHLPLTPALQILCGDRLPWGQGWAPICALSVSR